MRYISRIFYVFICYTNFVNFRESRRDIMTLLEATRERIDELCKLNNMNINQLAELLEIKPQSVRNKLSRNSFTLSEFEKVINSLEADLQVVSRKTKNIYH